MFSGIVETIGTVISIHDSEGCRTFVIKPALSFANLVIGESIAINGVCLTVTQFDESTFTITAVPETLRLTNLAHLNTGSKVNLERALLATARMGGHYVQGHIDCLGTILSIQEDHGAWLIEIQIPAHVSRYIVKKGYITVDGMSLTIVNCTDHSFTLTLIPHTHNVTIAQHYTASTTVNIEVDIMGKYVEKILGASTHANRN